jgi:hypothetical protein
MKIKAVVLATGEQVTINVPDKIEVPVSKEVPGGWITRKVTRPATDAEARGWWLLRNGYSPEAGKSI